RLRPQPQRPLHPLRHRRHQTRRPLHRRPHLRHPVGRRRHFRLRHRPRDIRDPRQLGRPQRHALDRRPPGRQHRGHQGRVKGLGHPQPLRPHPLRLHRRLQGLDGPPAPPHPHPPRPRHPPPPHPRPPPPPP